MANILGQTTSPDYQLPIKIPEEPFFWVNSGAGWVRDDRLPNNLSRCTIRIIGLVASIIPLAELAARCDILPTLN